MRRITKFITVLCAFLPLLLAQGQTDSLPVCDSSSGVADTTISYIDDSIQEWIVLTAPETGEISEKKNFWGNGIRIVNLHSTRVLNKGRLDFCVQHRFGYLSGGRKEFWGLDQSYYRIGFDYGLLDRVTLGIGRSNVGKMLNSYAKWAIVEQNNKEPLSVSWLSDIAMSMEHPPTGLEPYYWTHRIKYTHQLILSRTFGDSRFMLQLAPTLVHRNLTDSSSEPNDLALITSDLRFRLTKKVSVTGEYCFLFHRDIRSQLNAGSGFGLEFYTGGHVFQLLVTNAYFMNEPGILTMQNGSVPKREIRFGFNISRSF